MEENVEARQLFFSFFLDDKEGSTATDSDQLTTFSETSDRPKENNEDAAADQSVCFAAQTMTKKHKK